MSALFGGQAAGDVFPEEGDFRLRQQQRAFRRVGGDDGLGGIPIHQREVVVGGVLGVGEEGFDDLGVTRPILAWTGTILANIERI